MKALIRLCYLSRRRDECVVLPKEQLEDVGEASEPQQLAEQQLEDGRVAVGSLAGSLRLNS